MTYDRPLQIVGGAVAVARACGGDDLLNGDGPPVSAATFAGRVAAVRFRGPDATWLWPPCEAREALRGALVAAGAEATDVPGGLARFEVRGAKATRVLETALGAAALDDEARDAFTITVVDPRETTPRGDPSDDASWDIFAPDARAASSAAVRARRDDVVNADRHSPTPAPPLRVNVLVVRRRGNGVVPGWDLTVPPGWARAFWVKLVHSGGHAAGRRERSFLAALEDGADPAKYLRDNGPGRIRLQKNAPTPPGPSAAAPPPGVS